MSKEYVPREEVIKILESYDLSDSSILGYHSGAIDCAIFEIEMLPAADVIEKKHGYWIKRIIENEEEDYPIRNVNYICSRCEGCWHEPLKYCPMCLAEMDKEVTNA
jgi:hypothetical protein|nr:MAG TPA_asm: putative zinc-ribbon [Caudoviricetes sp.]